MLALAGSACASVYIIACLLFDDTTGITVLIRVQSTAVLGWSDTCRWWTRIPTRCPRWTSPSGSPEATWAVRSRSSTGRCAHMADMCPPHSAGILTQQCSLVNRLMQSAVHCCVLLWRKLSKGTSSCSALHCPRSEWESAGSQMSCMEPRSRDVLKELETLFVAVLVALKLCGVRGSMICNQMLCTRPAGVWSADTKTPLLQMFLHVCADCKLHNTSKLLPPASAPDPPPVPQAPHRDDAQEPAAHCKIGTLGV